MGQMVETVILIQFIVTAEHTVFSPGAIGISVVAVFDLSQRLRNDEFGASCYGPLFFVVINMKQSY